VSASREGDDDIEMDDADSLSRGGGDDPRLRPGAGGADSSGRGPASTVKPMSVKAGLMSSPVTVLWHDIDPTRNFSARCLVVSGFQVLLIRNQIRDLAKT
jgi:hypothetical protein